jgi:hypothetical protein
MSKYQQSPCVIDALTHIISASDSPVERHDAGNRSIYLFRTSTLSSQRDFQQPDTFPSTPKEETSHRIPKYDDWS